jgi:hypothetical protein
MGVFNSYKTEHYFRGLRLRKPKHDESYKDLLELSKQTPEYIQRARTQIFTYYQGVDKSGVIRFMTPSGTTPGLYWIQTLLLKDLKRIVKVHKNKKKPIELVRLALKGNISVSCNAPDGEEEPSWVYHGFQYKATQSGYNLGRDENRFPEIRNPKLKGSVCKHLRAVLAALPFHVAIITRDLKAKGLLS